LYSGRVQGVGFRQTALHLARRHPVAGFVRNLPSGQVELVAQGDAAAVDGLIAEVARRMGSNIERADAEALPVQDFAGFEIRR